MQKLIQEILQEYNKAFLPRLNETQPVEVLFDFELITIREVVSLHTAVNPFTPVGAHRVTYRFYSPLGNPLGVKGLKGKKNLRRKDRL